MKSVKVVVVGAGSLSFGRGTIADLLAADQLNRQTELTVVLVDTDEEALERMYNFAQVLKDYRGASTRLEATTDRAEALPGADYVIIAVARQRLELWQQDFYVPLSYGFKHIYGENGGPGAAFHTLRSIHLTMPIIRDVERLCPEALVLNFTNPESRVCLAISRLTEVEAAGICHGPFATLAKVAEVLGKEPEQIELTVGGINHFHWVLGIKDATDGADLYPRFAERMEQQTWGLDPLVRYFYDTYGLLTYPAESHPGEYVGFAYSLTGPVFEHYRKFHVAWERGSEDQLPFWKIIQQVADGEAPMTEELAKTSGEVIIPIIEGIEFDSGDRIISANVPNSELSVANLPADAIVEVPLTVDAQGLHPIGVGPLPEAIAAMCRLQTSIQELLVEAYRQRSKRVLLQALLLEPTVDNAERAEQMMEELLSRQADFLPCLQ